MAHGMYRIKVTKWCKPQEVLLDYAACTHPQKGDVLWYRDKPMSVGLVSHILTTYVDGNGETHSLSYVEIQVLK